MAALTDSLPGVARVPHPVFMLSYGQKNITNDITPYVLSVTYTDYLSGQSDELEVELEDADGRWINAWYPGKGDTLSLRIGYEAAPLLPCGTFEIDEIEFARPPSTVSIRGLATGIRKSVRTRTGRAYENTTLAAIAQRIAKRHKMTLVGKIEPLQIDLGRCVLCGDCESACPAQKISFNNDVKLGATTREGLTISAAHPEIDPIKVNVAMRKRFGRSLKLRSVSAGGCNGCEMELNAVGNVNFDFGRYGIDMVASPRHADGLVLTGPISSNMVEELRICWDAMPEPKLVIAMGACAISGGVFAECAEVDRSFLKTFKPALYVPGCPTHPLVFIAAVMDFLGIDAR